MAAIAVVASHAAQIIPIYGRGDSFTSFHIGAAGVDTFFVISGFIMCHITDNDDKDGLRFFKRRLARVAPAYWIITSMIALVMLVFPTIFRTSEFSVPLYFASLAFLGWPNAATGDAQPLLLIGWTLNYEFFFYSLFAVIMSFTRKNRISVISIIFIILISIGLIIKFENPVTDFYTNTIVIEFIFGMFLWKINKIGLLKDAYVGYSFILISIFIFISVDRTIWVERDSLLRPLYWGVPGSILVAGVLCLESGRKIRRYKFLYNLGDASYSIYLSHIITLGVVRFIWGKFELKQWLPDSMLLIVGLVGSTIIGYLFHVFVEKTASSQMRSFMFRRRQAS